MNQRGIINVLLILLVVVLTCLGAYYELYQQATSSHAYSPFTPSPATFSTSTPDPVPAPIPVPTPNPKPIPPGPIACTQEAKLCPDGSYVGRTGKNCEFTPCPAVEIPPSPGCVKDSDCSAGDVCHNNICTNPIGRVCNDSSDLSCPADYKCVQGCGAPVSYPGEPAPPYFCQLNGYRRMCPICLSIGTLIDTPQGAVPVQQLQKGMPVWTTNKSGERIAGVILMVSQVSVAPDHQMVQLELTGGRKLLVSPGHPTIDGRLVGDLVVGDLYNGARVVSSSRVIYGEPATYDLLPSGETGFYWANGVLLDSTLR